MKVKKTIEVVLWSKVDALDGEFIVPMKIVGME